MTPYQIYVPKKYLVLVILFHILVLKCIVQYNPLGTLYSKIPLLVLILLDVEEYCWPHYDISISKANT